MLKIIDITLFCLLVFCFVFSFFTKFDFDFKQLLYFVENKITIMDGLRNKVGDDIITLIITMLTIDQLLLLKLCNKYYYLLLSNNVELCMNFFSNIASTWKSNKNNHGKRFKMKIELLKICVCFRNTMLGRVYSRLLPFSYELMYLPMLNVYKNFPFYTLSRWTQFESSLFPICKAGGGLRNIIEQECNDEMVINGYETFICKLKMYFYYDLYKNFLCNNKLIIAGGSILKCISKFYEYKYDMYKASDVDFFAYDVCIFSFRHIVRNFIKILDNENLFYSAVWRDNIVTIHVMFSSNRKFSFQFIWNSVWAEPIHILHAFDLDCVQIGFDGKQVLSSLGNMYSLKTGTFISYAASNHMSERSVNRIFKYISRGFLYISPRKLLFRYFTHPDYVHAFNDRYIDVQDLKEMVAEAIRRESPNYPLFLRRDSYIKNANFDALGIIDDFLQIITKIKNNPAKWHIPKNVQ